MPIDVVCDNCSKSYRVADDRAGRKVRCGCGSTFVISAPAELSLDALGELETSAESTAAEPVMARTVDDSHDAYNDDSDGDWQPPTRTRSPMDDMPVEERMRLGKEDMRDRDFEKAARHFFYVAAHTIHPEAPRLLQDALKLQIPSVYIFRTIGLKAPWASDAGISKFYLIAGVVLMGILSTVVKYTKNNPQFERTGVWIMAGIAGLICLGRIVDYAATFRIRKLMYGEFAVTRGDMIGSIIGIILMIVATGLAIMFAARVSVPMSAAGVLAFASAGGIYLICKTPTRTGTFIVAAIFLVLLITGIVGVIGIAAQATPGNLHQRLPTAPSICVLVSFLGIMALRPLQSVIVEFTGTQEAFIDNTTVATRGGRLQLSKSKLRRLHPEAFGLRSLVFRFTNGDLGVSAKDARALVAQALQHGDAQPAMVVTTEPLVVAAYSDDLDDVILLEFDQKIGRDLNLTRGKRLVSVNTYGPMSERDIAPDVQFGPKSTQVWGNAHPHIANFLSDDQKRLMQLEQSIAADEWNRLKQRLSERLTRPHKPRHGRPLYCHVARSVYDGEP